MSQTLEGGLGLKALAITDTVTEMVELQNANVNIIDKIYPIGSIYISTASTNPSAFLGGTWSQLEGRFLVGAGGKFAAGTTGGSEDMGIQTCGEEATGYGMSPAGGFTNRVIVNKKGYTGKVLPPYLAVYMWERTA